MSVSRIVFGITLVAALSGSLRANAAAAPIKAGVGESIKTWADKTNDQATAAHRPILLYIYDTDEKRNVTAQSIEGPKFLGDSSVKAKESGLLLLKDKMGEGNGYPQEWVQQANGGAVLLVLSADMKVVQSFSKANKDKITAENLVAAIDAAVKASGNVPPPPKQPDNTKKAANDKKQPAKKNG
jgi:hypothetical protein